MNEKRSAQTLSYRTGKALASKSDALNTNTLNAGSPAMETALTTSWDRYEPSTDAARTEQVPATCANTRTSLGLSTALSEG